MISWIDKDPITVERAIKSLIRRMYPDARAIDGSGGDGGRDLVRSTPAGLVVFEIKSYSRRLTDGQKRKIRASLQSAIRQDMTTWILVLPLDHTPSEQEWFEGYLQDLAGHVKLEWWGRDWLDGQFAAHEDLRRYVEGSAYALLGYASELGLEAAALTRGIEDVIDRTSALARRTDELSPFWRLDMQRDANEFTFVWSEKYPGAAADDPVVLKPTFRFAEADSAATELRQALERTLEYGGEVSIPGKYVNAFDIECSEETKRLFGRAADGSGQMGLRLKSSENNEGLPLLVNLVLVGRDSHVKNSLAVSLNRRVGGVRGVTLYGSDHSGILEVTMRVSFGQDGRIGGGFDLRYKGIAGRFPYAILPALGLFDGAESDDTIRIDLGPTRLASSNPIGVDGVPGGQLVEFVGSLARLQDYGGKTFPIPVNPKVEEVEEVIAFALVVDGKSAVTKLTTMNVEIWPDKLSGFLNMPELRADGALYTSCEQVTLDIDGHSINVGPVAWYAPRIRLMNRSDLERSDKPARPIAIFRCVDCTFTYSRPIEAGSEGDGDVRAG
jgi:hypothetical protein